MRKVLSYPLGKTIKELLLNVNRQDKGIYLYFMVYTITAAIYPFFLVLLPKILIQELSLGPAARVENIIKIVIGYFILTSVFMFTKTLAKDYAYPRITKLRIDYIRDMFDKLVRVDYKYMEDASFLR